MDKLVMDPETVSPLLFLNSIQLQKREGEGEAALGPGTVRSKDSSRKQSFRERWLPVLVGCYLRPPTSCLSEVQ